MVEGSKEVGARRRTPKGNEGSKAHSKGGRVGNTLPLMVESSKAHSKGGRVGNALPLIVEGLKAHSKEMRARRRTQKEVG